MKEVTVSNVFLRQVLQGAQGKGLDCMPILRRNGISASALTLVDHRVPLQSFAAVTFEIMRELDDEFIGLTRRRQPMGSFAMMCRACISARSIKHSIKRAANFWNLFNNAYRHDVFISGGRVFYEISLLEGEQPLNHYGVESMLSSVHRFHCWLSGQFIPLISVSMGNPRPDHSAEYRALYYGAPIKYDQPYWQFEFDARHAALEVLQTSDTLDSYLADSNLSLLFQPNLQRAISDQLRHWLEKNIKLGNNHTSLLFAAKHFKMSQQVLHRRLQAEDTSFKEIKMQTRRDIAINLLFTGRYKIEEIATQVGFSEPSAFVRAFKGWTGSTPLNYRQANR